MLIIVSHLGTVMFGVAAILYERYFSPEMYDIEKRRKHLATLRKKVHAKVKNRWGGLKNKHASGKNLKKGDASSNINSIAGFMAHQELEEMADDDVDVVSPGASLFKQMRSRGLLAKKNKRGMFGMSISPGKVAPIDSKHANGGDLSMKDQLQALRDAQDQIGEESKAPVDFDWGDEHDEDTDSEEDRERVQDNEISNQLKTFSHKDMTDSEEEDDDDDGPNGSIFELHTPDDIQRFQQHMNDRAQQIENSFAELHKFVKMRADKLKTSYINDRYDEKSGMPALARMVKAKIQKLLDKNGAISELHTYLDYVKEQVLLRRAVGPVVLKRATDSLTGLEETALQSLRAALGMDGEHPEKRTLEEQEEVLEKAVGAVMQCGRMEDADHATPLGPLLKTGIQMMTEIDRCRELNKMLKKSLFGSPEALKSFSGLRTMSPAPESLQNTVRAMFVLIGSDPKSVAKWDTTKKLCSPAGYNTLQKRIEEISPLLANMTKRVEISLELTKGHENISSMPTGEGSQSFCACHTWVQGVMSACGVDDPRSQVGDGATTKEDKVAEAAKAVGDANARAIAGAAEFGHGSDGDSSSVDSVSSSDSDDDESPASKAAPPAAVGGGSGVSSGSGGNGGGAKAESSSSSSSGSESSDDEQDDASNKKPAAATKGLPKPPPGMPKPPPAGPESGAQPKPPPRLKTTPSNVVLPSSDFVPEVKKSSDEEEESLSETSSESDNEE
jgi:hypothetical protein